LTKKIFVRVDSGLEIGTGHLMRCLALAEIIKDYGFKICFISKELEGNVYDLILKKGFEIKYIANNKNNEELIESDASDVLKIISKEKEKPHMIVDHYNLDEKWEEIVRKNIKKLIVIDDLANRKHNCDLLLDYNLYENMEKRYSGLLSEQCKLLLGPEYGLLRKEFLYARENAFTRKKFHEIMISFGGSDPDNETTKVLIALKKIQFENLRINVIIRNTNPNKNRIKELCSSIKNCFLYNDIENIEEFMLKSDLAIGAGGITTWERCCLGLPSVVATIADNQIELTETIAKRNCIIYLGNSKKLIPEDYEKCLKEINSKTLTEMSTKCFEIIDGRGCFRVSENIYKLLKEKSV